MAFESLSMISNALTKLEAGEISVVSFGETISLLHPFEKSFIGVNQNGMLYLLSTSLDTSVIQKNTEESNE